VIRIGTRIIEKMFLIKEINLIYKIALIIYYGRRLIFKLAAGLIYATIDGGTIEEACQVC
jgi:hypothetical protein